MFAGVWTALVTFYMTREILPVASAKAAAVLTGVFPSMVLWSILNIRDALATLCTVLIVLYGMRLSKRFQLSHLWIFAAAVLGLSLIRDYMAFLVWGSPSEVWLRSAQNGWSGRCCSAPWSRWR